MNISNFRSALLVLSLPAIWLGSFAFSIQDDHVQLSDEFAFIPVSIQAFQTVNYGLDQFGVKFVPLDEDIFIDPQSSDEGSKSPVYISPPENHERDRDDDDEDIWTQSGSGSGGGNSGQDSGDTPPNRGNGNGNGGGNGKGKSPNK